MYRVSEMIGKPVVSTATGAKLGTVSDALLEAGGVRLTALVVGGGVFSKEHVLPLSDIQTFGRDAVLARTDEHLMDARTWRQSGVEATRSSALRGRRVVTTSGEEIGQVSDFLIDDQTGQFRGLEVEAHSLGGFRTRRVVIPPEPAPRIGPDAIVVNEAVLAKQPDEPEGEPH